MKRENTPIPMRFNKLYVIYEKDQDLVGSSFFIFEHSSKNQEEKSQLLLLFQCNPHANV